MSEYLAQKAQKLKYADGILATTWEKVGKKLKPQAKQAVLDFYENDEYFQQMPGKNNNVSISLETHKQKRLLLCNFKELSQEFKVKNPIIGIGFSKFARLRPKWYVAIGVSGTYQASAYEKQGRATIAHLVTKFRDYRRVKSHTPSTK